MSGLFSGSAWSRPSAALFLSFALLAASPASASVQQNSASGLSLKAVLQQVKQNDFRLKQFSEEAQAYQAESESASYLPDPTVFAAIQSLPTDTFDLDQEPMTQLRFGVRQMFPKGDMLDISASMSGIKSELQNDAGKLRWLERRKQTEQAWLEAWYWQKNLEILEQDKTFLEQVREFIRSLYEVGARDQSDLIGADLELIKLEEKRVEAIREFRTYRSQLNTLANQSLPGEWLLESLPDLAVIEPAALKQEDLERYLLAHPKIHMLSQQMALSDKKVEMMDQDFKPAWGLELSYGLRDGENMDGSQRPDFFSAGVNVQVPLFAEGKQGQNRKAAEQRTRVARLAYDEALSEMRFQIESLQLQHRHTREQRLLYETDILPTIDKQLESALQAYESDRGDFRLVISLFLKEQSAKTMHQRLRVKEQKLLSSLNFLLGLDDTHTEGEAL